MTAARLIGRQVGSTTAAVAAEAGLDVGDGPDAFRARSAFVGQPDPSALDVVARLVEASTSPRDSAFLATSLARAHRRPASYSGMPSSSGPNHPSSPSLAPRPVRSAAERLRPIELTRITSRHCQASLSERTIAHGGAVSRTGRPEVHRCLGALELGDVFGPPCIAQSAEPPIGGAAVSPVVTESVSGGLVLALSVGWSLQFRS
jgi:hypothetical protein